MLSGLRRTLLPVRSLKVGKAELSTLTLTDSQANATGSYLKEDVSPELKHPDYFGVHSLISMEKLFDKGAHFGHKSSLRNPYMAEYLYGSRLGHDIFDLNQTTALLKDALNVLAHIAYRGGVILFVSRNKQMIPEIEAAARECGEYAHCREWKSGTFTNSSLIYGSVTRLPDACVFLSTQNTVFKQHEAVVESAKLLIPTFGIVDSDCDPRLISYPVPANDDTPRAMRFYLDTIKSAILKGKQKAKEDDVKKK